MSKKYYGYARGTNGEVTIYDDCLIFKASGQTEERISYGDVVNLQFLLPQETDGLRGTLSIRVKDQGNEYDLHFHDPGVQMFEALHKKAAKLADVWKKKYARV